MLNTLLHQPSSLTPVIILVLKARAVGFSLSTDASNLCTLHNRPKINAKTAEKLHLNLNFNFFHLQILKMQRNFEKKKKCISYFNNCCSRNANATSTKIKLQKVNSNHSLGQTAKLALKRMLHKSLFIISSHPRTTPCPISPSVCLS